MNTDTNVKIILFDGVCNLCNSTVQFVIKRDSKSIFRFASLQGASGQKLLTDLGLKQTQLLSIILIDGERAFDRSSAILRICRELDGPCRYLYVFHFIPKPLRDAVYSIVARNRYSWFGRLDACWLPTPELKKRFLDD